MMLLLLLHSARAAAAAAEKEDDDSDDSEDSEDSIGSRPGGGDDDDDDKEAGGSFVIAELLAFDMVDAVDVIVVQRRSASRNYFWTTESFSSALQTTGKRSLARAPLSAAEKDRLTYADTGRC
jgi:hypothetical protein